MKIAILSLIYSVAMSSPLPPLSQRLEAVVIAANKQILGEGELKALEKSFQFPSDHAVFEQIKRRKRVFTSSGMSMSRKYNSLFVSRGRDVVVEMNFNHEGNKVVINGKLFSFSRDSALTPQVEAFVQSHEVVRFDWHKILWPTAHAQRANSLSEELQAIVMGILAASNQFLLGQFSVSTPSMNTSSVLSTFNQKEFTKVSPLTCLKDVSTGTVDVKVNQDHFTVNFSATTREDSFHVDFKIGDVPQVIRAKLKADRETFKKVACMHVNARNGVRVPLSSVDPATKNRFMEFENFLVQLQQGPMEPPTRHPIFRACSSPEKNRPTGTLEQREACVELVCRGGVTALDFGIKFENFDLALVPALKEPAEQFKRVQADLAASIAALPKGELTEGNSPLCQTPTDLGDCRISMQLLQKHSDLAAKFAAFTKGLGVYRAQFRDYAVGLDGAVYIANAAHACCLDSPACPEYYNKIVVPAANSGGPRVQQ